MEWFFRQMDRRKFGLNIWRKLAVNFTRKNCETSNMFRKFTHLRFLRQGDGRRFVKNTSHLQKNTKTS